MTFYTFIFMLLSLLDGDMGLAILFTIIFVLSILVRFTLAAAINKDAADKHLDSKTMWTILTFIFTIPVAVIYAFVTRKADDTKSNAKSRRTLTIISIVIYIVAFAAFGSFLIRGQSPDAFDEYTQCVYENELGEKVIYDKKGKEYTYDDIYNADVAFSYYDENNTPFIKLLDWGYDEYEATLPTSKDEFGNDVYDAYSTSDSDIVIDENGCLHSFRYKDSKLELVKSMTYQDKEGNTYYDVSAVGWDKDGNLVFSQFYMDSVKEEAKASPNQKERLTLEYGVFLLAVLLFLIMLSKAVDYDAKSRAIKKSGMYADIAFFGGIFGVIYYLTTRNNAQKVDDDKLTEDEKVLKEYERTKQGTKAKVSAVIGVVALAAVLALFVHLHVNNYTLADFISAVAKLIGKYMSQ